MCEDINISDWLVEFTICLMLISVGIISLKSDGFLGHVYYKLCHTFSLSLLICDTKSATIY